MAEPRWHEGMFPWRELMTVDVEGARRFYGELFGWSWKSEEVGPDDTYWLASLGGRPVAGMIARPKNLQIPSAWFSYVLVDEVDAASERCREAGGRVLRAPDDIPGIGRFSIVGDRWGAVLYLFRATDRETVSPVTTVHTFSWETLAARDPAGAVAFWQKVVGFGTAKTPSGDGTMFTAGEAPVADVRQADAPGPSYWRTYVAVESAERSRDLAARLGGQVLVPRVEVPKAGIVSFVADPSGAALGLFQAVR